MRLPISLGLVSALALMVGGANAIAEDHGRDRDHDFRTATPIKHLVVIFDENRSFDHYFGTYPNALNPEGEPIFEPARHTPRDVNNLLSDPTLLTNNPNLNPANGTGASNPFRLDRTQANTADQSHNYTREQQADDNGKLDLFPLDVGRGTKGGAGAFGTTGQVMGYFDGNTVTGLWNYAQHFAMSDNAFTDTFGPSTPGLLNMYAGQTNGATFPIVPAAIASAPDLGAALLAAGVAVPDGQGGLTLIQDIDPVGDVCSSPTFQVQMTGKNTGDLLNAANIPWGSFVGGFNLQTANANGTTGCLRSSFNPVTGGSPKDYIPHHIWFQYFASTANPTHARPTSVQAIGHSKVPGTQTPDPANHGYDLDDFFTAVKAGNFPSVSYIKASAFQDGHPGNSDPLSEQQGLVSLLNFLQQQPDWKNTAVIFTYDDSDGQYDHVPTKITSASFSGADAFNGPGVCGVGVNEPNGVKGLPVAGRCGPGNRIPFLVISPFAKRNFVSHTLITQASVARFIEDNWLHGERLGGGSFDATAGSIMDMFDFDRDREDGVPKLILDPAAGTVVSASGFRDDDRDHHHDRDHDRDHDRH
ncbi:MAG TPA: alkaline phosphatase family protein [Bradyrhizobium sp.]|nr:alkaline phosphatase family protein [Bradyrhizobium sp.]